MLGPVQRVPEVSAMAAMVALVDVNLVRVLANSVIPAG
jgi:hypothetical protein